ncbi:MAG: 6,7-dimethyl-8-ribityllumazine synthase [Parachlamydiaceae bacterium]
MKEYSGDFQGKGLRIGIVVSRFNELVTKSLLTGAVDGLVRHGVDHEDIAVAWVPGAFEIPLVAKTMALSDKYDAIICLGAVIRGATAHFDHVIGQAASGIAHIALECNLPLIFEVLATNTLEDALERAGSKSGNKGFDAALIAIETAQLLIKLRENVNVRCQT